jgi:transposase
LRRLLALGATAVIQQVERRRKANKTSGNDSPWLLQLLARKPKKLAAIALANKACPGAGRGWPASSGPCW